MLSSSGNNTVFLTCSSAEDSGMVEALWIILLSWGFFLLVCGGVSSITSMSGRVISCEKPIVEIGDASWFMLRPANFGAELLTLSTGSLSASGELDESWLFWPLESSESTSKAEGYDCFC